MTRKFHRRSARTSLLLRAGGLADRRRRLRPQPRSRTCRPRTLHPGDGHAGSRGAAPAPGLRHANVANGGAAHLRGDVSGPVGGAHAADEEDGVIIVGNLLPVTIRRIVVDGRIDFDAGTTTRCCR